MTAALDQLQSRLGHQFQDSELLQRALTHRSASKDNNERLEFLGDALLDFLLGEALFKRYPDAAEGELSRLRAELVNKSALAKIGKSLQLGDFMRLGSGEARSGGKQRDSILADAIEALIAAVYLDAGIEPCRELVSRLSSDMLEKVQPSGESRDAKTRLQELLQSRGQALPSYEVIDTEGAAHNQIFHVQCQAPGLVEATRGSGSSKRKAEQAAAKQALELLS
jgi:ribonuclease-3